MAIILNRGATVLNIIKSLPNHTINTQFGIKWHPNLASMETFEIWQKLGFLLEMNSCRKAVRKKKQNLKTLNILCIFKCGSVDWYVGLWICEYEFILFSRNGQMAGGIATKFGGYLHVLNHHSGLAVPGSSVCLNKEVGRPGKSLFTGLNIRVGSWPLGLKIDIPYKVSQRKVYEDPKFDRNGFNKFLE